MKQWQFWCVLAVIVVSPHMPKHYSLLAGFLYFSIAAVCAWRNA